MTIPRAVRMLAPALLLAGCASVPPGEDLKGQQLKEPAGRVLAAVTQFNGDQGRYPSSLYELVPKYLQSLPDEPGLKLDAYVGTLSFAYSQEWPQLTRVLCTTRLQAADWKCEEYK